MELIESALRVSTPLVFAALGGVLSERVGVVNIGLEGMLLAGAFAAWTVAFHTGDPWIGLLAAAVVGILLGLLHAFAVLKLRVDAIISGVAINLLAAGLTSYLLGVMSKGTYLGGQVKALGAWLPGLAKLPVLGTLLGARTAFVPLALLAVAGVWFLVYRTRSGLQLRAVGEAPAAARAAGVVVDRARTLWLAAGGALAGIGGAYLSLEATGRFTQNASSGRGYLALAAVIFGRWHPLGAAAAVLAFGLGEALQITLQGRPVPGAVMLFQAMSAIGIQGIDWLKVATIPSEVMSALPYLLGLFALAGALGKTTPPAGLGQLD